jgi:SAP domain-containing ribonucleoprotein
VPAVVPPPVQSHAEKPVPNAKPVAPAAVKPTTQQDEEEKRRARAARFAGTPEDEEAKLKARAARFGVPLVEPAESKPSAPSPSTKVAVKAVDSPRLAAAATTRQKRSVPDEADPDELEKRRKRAQRFGLQEPVKSLSSCSDDIDPEELEKRRKRAERFALKEHVSSCPLCPVIDLHKSCRYEPPSDCVEYIILLVLTHCLVCNILYVLHDVTVKS